LLPGDHLFAVRKTNAARFAAAFASLVFCIASEQTVPLAPPRAAVPIKAKEIGKSRLIHEKHPDLLP
jgi:hypothetical protein